MIKKLEKKKRERPGAIPLSVLPESLEKYRQQLVFSSLCITPALSLPSREEVSRQVFGLSAREVETELEREAIAARR